MKIRTLINRIQIFLDFLLSYFQIWILYWNIHKLNVDPF